MVPGAGSYVQYGAGFSGPPGWLNFDASPTLRLQRLPVVGAALARLSGNAEAFPPEIRYGDIIRGLPVAKGSVAGLYASHVLEHLALDDMRVALKQSFDLLRPGGIFRLIVPDLLQRAKLYVEQAEAGDADASHRFMQTTYLGQESRPGDLRGRVRAQLGNSSHLWMWDHVSIERELAQVGFVGIRRAHLGDSGDPMFDRVEDAVRFVDGEIVEVAIEARKP